MTTEKRQELEKLFKANMPFAVFVLKRYFSTLSLTDDLIQIAYLGLWKACLSWDQERAKFTTYAAICIQKEVLMELRRRKKWGQLQMVSLSCPTAGEGEDLTLEGLVPDPHSDINDLEDCIAFSQALEELGLSDIERELLHLSAQGISQAEVGHRLSKSQAYVSRKLGKIKKRLMATYEH